MEFIEITIPKWESYNPRKDLKATTWLRLQNTLFEDPSFFEFTHEELNFWVYILCLASRKQAGKVKIMLAHAERVGRFSQEAIDSALKKLVILGTIEITEDARHAHVTRTSRGRDVDVTRTLRARHTTNERTNVTNETNETFATRDAKVTPKTHASWEAYRHAYATRYGTAPVRTAKVNAQLSKLVDYLGATEAPQVIEFYLTHNSSWYAQKGHDLGLLLTDYQKLRTEWITGRQITTAQAKSTEAKQHNVQVVQDWLAKKAGEGGVTP